MTGMTVRQSLASCAGVYDHANADEVEAVFETPLSFVMDDGNARM